jgi:hypothetical protein
MQRIWVGLAALALVIVAPHAPAGAQDADVAPFEGLGAWVDVFDYAPAYLQEPGPPPVVPETIDDLDRLGADTVYLQAAFDDTRSEGLIVDRDAVGQLLRRAHDRGMAVVAWYYPQLVDAERDFRHLRALLDFRSGGQRFDAIALDIESTQVADVADRNHRIVDLARQVRKEAGDDMAIGAIVYPAVQLEVLNVNLWPDFPYRKLARSVDVWLPMVYWGFREAPYRDAGHYTRTSVDRLRKNLRDPDAAVHPVGGLAADSTTQDYVRFVRASERLDALGWSVYDVDTTFTPAWAYLRGDATAETG